MEKNANNGPNLAVPEIAYTATLLTSASSGGQYQIDSTWNQAQRNPMVYTNQTGVLCSHDGSWVATNYNSYEAINLNNANASGGTFYGVNCYPNGG